MSRDDSFDFENVPEQWREPVRLLRGATIQTSDVPKIMPKFTSKEESVLFWYMASLSYQFTVSVCHVSKEKVSRVLEHWRNHRQVLPPAKIGRPKTMTERMAKRVEMESRVDASRLCRLGERSCEETRWTPKAITTET